MGGREGGLLSKQEVLIEPRPSGGREAGKQDEPSFWEKKDGRPQRKKEGSRGGGEGGVWSLVCGRLRDLGRWSLRESVSVSESECVSECT